MESIINISTFAVHGGWGGWSTWGSCSSTCGIGLQRRDRACDSPWPSRDGNPCFGESLTYEICADFQCMYIMPSYITRHYNVVNWTCLKCISVYERIAYMLFIR